MSNRSKLKRDAPAAYNDDVIDLDALIRDYGSDDAPSKPKRKNDQLNRDAVIQPPRVSLQVSYNLAHVPDYVEENPEHRKQAAIAHLIVVIGILISFASLGALMPLAIIIARRIYTLSRARSPFLAHHSLQAAVVLTGATLGWFTFMIISLVAAVAFFGEMVYVSGTVAAMLPLLWLAFAVVPIGTFSYGCVGIVQALRGRTFRYPHTLFSVGKIVHKLYSNILRVDRLIG